MPEQLNCTGCGECAESLDDDGLCPTCVANTCGQCGGEVHDRTVGDEYYRQCESCGYYEME